VVAPRHAGSFPDEKAPRTPSFDLSRAGSDVSTLPGWTKDAPTLSDQTIAGVDNIYRLAAGSLRAVDEGVERLYQALADTGELDNTVFVFTSDNGYHYGDRRIIIGKSDQYEESVHMPLLVRGPGFPAGRVVTQPVANVDLAPTIAGIAGVPLGREADGVPLGRFVADPTYGANRTVVIENGPLQGRRTYKGVRDQRWTYIESLDSRYGIVHELYDRSVDPYETHNLVNDGNAVLYLLERAKRAGDLAQCTGAACYFDAP
jgi:N-acetylglucosamine-6-sulfatase